MGEMQMVVGMACRKEVEPQYVEMMVPLYSYGCERKINNTLSHLKGIYSVNVDYRQQKVTVWGICNKHHVLATVKSKRKDARFWNTDDNNMGLVQQAPAPAPAPRVNMSLPLPSLPLKHLNLSFKLTRATSLNFKAWIQKKVFTRSNSF